MAEPRPFPSFVNEKIVRPRRLVRRKGAKIEPRSFSSLANEETKCLKWFEAFMRGRCGVLWLIHRVIPTKPIIRVELEQQMYADSNIVHEPVADSTESISGLQTLLENAPSLPESKLSWHRALEELLDGTRDGSKLPLTILIEVGDKNQWQKCTLE